MTYLPYDDTTVTNIFLVADAVTVLQFLFNFHVDYFHLDYGKTKEERSEERKGICPQKAHRNVTWSWLWVQNTVIFVDFYFSQVFAACNLYLVRHLFEQACVFLFTVDDPGAGASTFLSPSSMLTPSAASAAAAVSAPKPQPNYNVSINGENKDSFEKDEESEM